MRSLLNQPLDPTRHALDIAEAIVAKKARDAALTEEIARLVAEQEEVRRELGELHSAFATIVQGGANGHPRNTSGSAVSAASRIEAFLNSDPQRALDVSEIHRANVDVDIATLRSTLARLDRENRVVRVGRGRYAGRGYAGDVDDEEGD